MTTKEMVKEMMKPLENELIYEDEDNLEYTNPVYGENICFEFKNNILITVYSWQTENPMI